MQVVKNNKRDWTKIFAISIAIVQMIVLLIIFGVKKRIGSYPERMPEDFNFVASFWTDSYKIDTNKNIYTKALNWEADTIISLCLTNEEKELIYKKKKIDIYKYPHNYAPTSTISVSPSFSFSIKVSINGHDHSINWTENTESKNKDAKRLMELFENITEQIEKHEEVKRLPKSKRFFY